MLVTFAKCLDPDQAQQKVGPVLDKKEVDLEKISRRQKSIQIYPVGKVLVNCSKDKLHSIFLSEHVCQGLHFFIYI